MADILRNVVGKQLLYGYSVYFTENGASVPYVLVGKGNNDNYLFMRRYAPSDKVAFFAEAASAGTTDSERIYDGRTLDKFCKETFYKRFTANWQRILVDQLITVTRASDGQTYGINRKVFAPSATELCIGDDDGDGTVPTEGTAYQYFMTAAQSKRMCRLGGSNGEYVRWWTRTKNNHIGSLVNYYGVTVETNGSYDAKAWQKTAYYIRPVLSINGKVSIINDGSMWRIIPNLPPVLPSQTVSTMTVNSGSTIDLSWSAATDDDGPAAPKYRLQLRKDGGEWETVLETAETSYSKTIAYNEVVGKAEYRVQAFDSYDNVSDWAQIADITVVNNVAPTAPSYIAVNGRYMGESIAVTWGNASDSDGNLVGYKVYRSVDNGAYVLVSTTAANVYRETAGQWSTVKYKVHAYDSMGAVSTEYKEAAVSLSQRITMGIEIDADSDIEDGGSYEAGINDTETGKTLKFTITDSADDETYAIAVNCNSALSLMTNGNASKGSHSVTISKAVWQGLSNGSHYIEINVSNTKGDAIQETIFFDKDVSGAYITLAEPIVVESAEAVSKFLINVKRYVPTGATITVQVTNNANDTSPVWQTVDADKLDGSEFVAFTNTTVANGNAFNFIIKADRGTATSYGYISSVSGVFGQNLFEYILARLDALEGGN